MSKWRVGRKVGRTIYLQRGDEPSDDDHLIGVMDTTRLAARAVLAVNAYYYTAGGLGTPGGDDTTSREERIRQINERIKQARRGWREKP